MPINAIIYARSSYDCPITAEEQVEHLKAVAADRGWTVARTIIDHPLPLKKGREQRPGETALLDAIQQGDVQKVLVWSIDRVGRTLNDLVTFLEICRVNGVGIYLDQQRIDTDGSNGLSLFDLSEMMALHVRQTRRDKILRGQQIARGNSLTKWGRPKLTDIKPARVERAKQALINGLGVRPVARMTGISPASVWRLKVEMGQISVR